MKKAVIMILAAAMMAFCACGRTGDATVDPTKAPAGPTAEPTAAVDNTETVTPVPKPDPVIGKITDLLTVPVGDGEKDVHYLYDVEGVILGPSAFAVKDGVVYILDSTKNSVLVCSGEERSAYPLDRNRRCNMFFVGASRTYAADDDQPFICVYDKDFKLEKTLNLPDGIKGLDLHLILSEDEHGILTVVTDDMVFYTCDPESGVWNKTISADVDCLSPIKSYKFDGMSFTIDAGEDTITTFLRFDPEAGKIWIIVNKQYDLGKMDTTLCLYDTEGSLLASADIKLTESITDNLLYPVFFANDGAIYLMTCLEDSVTISSIEF